MGLLIPWSCFLAVVDVYSLFLGCPLRLPGAIVLIAAGDWVRISINSVNSFAQLLYLIMILDHVSLLQ
jgi:hypothetical protein